MSGLKSARPFDFGTMAGVRQLREEEYSDQYKPSLMPPGSSNFLKVAQEQFNLEANGSGYMAEIDVPAWRRVPEHLKKLRLPSLQYDGTEKDVPADELIHNVGKKAKKNVPKVLAPGYDGAVAPIDYYEDDPPEVVMSKASEAVIERALKGTAKKASKGGTSQPGAPSKGKASVAGSNPAGSVGSSEAPTAQDSRATLITERNRLRSEIATSGPYKGQRVETEGQWKGTPSEF